MTKMNNVSKVLDHGEWAGEQCCISYVRDDHLICVCCLAFFRQQDPTYLPFVELSIGGGQSKSGRNPNKSPFLLAQISPASFFPKVLNALRQATVLILMLPTQGCKCSYSLMEVLSPPVGTLMTQGVLSQLNQNFGKYLIHTFAQAIHYNDKGYYSRPPPLVKDETFGSDHLVNKNCKYIHSSSWVKM